MKNYLKNKYTQLIVLFITISSVNAQSVGSWWGDSNGRDVLVTNPDKSNHYGQLRLQGPSNAFIVSNYGSMFGINYSTSGDLCDFSTAAKSTASLFTILPTGNVGIGSVTPEEKLHVVGNIKNTGGDLIYPATGYGIKWGENYSRIHDNGNLQILTDDMFYLGKCNSSGTMTATTITANVGTGNVGIGVSPQQNLSVGTGMNIDQNGANIGTLTNGLTFGNGSGEGIGSNRTSNGLNLWGLDFYTSSAKRISISNGGNVGIGTTPSSTYKLSVYGGINASDYSITSLAGTWSDYVFANDYKLPSLKETEAYIIAHKHLPNIPSEAEIKEKGYSLHDMNNNFLKTIEEMTLHSIEQEKKINSMASELAEIKALLLAKK